MNPRRAGGDDSRRRFIRKPAPLDAHCQLQSYTHLASCARRSLFQQSAMSSRSLPRLDARVLKQPGALSIVLGQIVEGDPRHKRRRQRILRLQKQLRDLVSDEAWRTYLRLEEACASRLGEATELVAVWAFHQGRRRR